tara:strand:+ start:1238 stop:1801 length:564 start_codon:yes stop_codon:yes gene_type:complete
MKELITFRAKINEWLVDDLIDLIVEAGRTEHDPATGRFPKGPAKKGDLYSMSVDGTKRAGIDNDFAGKGTFTGNVGKDGKNKINSLFGAASGKKACGRVDVQKGEIDPKYSCSNYSDLYEDEIVGEDDSQEQRVDRAYLAATVKNAIRDEVRKALARNNCSLSDLMLAVDKFERSKKGKLNEPIKSK